MGMIQVPPPADYSGRTLALNPEKARRFQCGHFVLFPTCPYAVVQPEADMGSLRQGLLEGRLLDITDQPRAGVQTEHATLQAVKREDIPGKIVYFVRQKLDDGTMGTVMAIPKDESEAQDFELQLKTTGRLVLKDLKKTEASGLTSIAVTDIPK